MECRKLKMETNLRTKQSKMESTSLDAKLTTPGGDQNQNMPNNDKIQCSVCEKKYDNITKYTHHLNMHLNSGQGAKDGESPQEVHMDFVTSNQSAENIVDNQLTKETENFHEKWKYDLKQTETSPFEGKAELPNEIEDKLELDMDLYNGQITKDIENQPTLNVQKQTTNIVENSQEKWESLLKQNESGFSFQTKEEFLNVRGDSNEFNIDQTTENKGNSKKWGNDFTESESESLFKTKLESQSEWENKEGFCETSKQKTVQNTLKTFHCIFCTKSFTQNGTLTVHINTVHKKLKAFTCKFCDKTFTRNSHLTRHVDAIHKKLKPFTCTLCDKLFAQRGTLTEHINYVHKKLKPFSCTFCYKTFTYKQDMDRHVDAIHRKLKPFSCRLCDKSFAQNVHLTKHVAKIHKARSNHSCKFCGDVFKRKNLLDEHAWTCMITKFVKVVPPGEHVSSKKSEENGKSEHVDNTDKIEHF